jgi:hypothetical protein
VLKPFTIAGDGVAQDVTTVPPLDTMLTRSIDRGFMSHPDDSGQLRPQAVCLVVNHSLTFIFQIDFPHINLVWVCAYEIFPIQYIG